MNESASLGKRSATALLAVLVLALLLFARTNSQAADGAAARFACAKPGWFPAGLKLKDHSVFYYNGYYYLISNRADGENLFAYGRTKDFCKWEMLSPVLSTRTPNTWDEMAVWAPFVLEEAGVYYLFYTGVTGDFTQSIMLATTTDPSNPDSWEKHGMIFQPSHVDSRWRAGVWADCRDPSVIKVGDAYYLYYTAEDETGGIIGLATAASPFGEWQDRGRVVVPEAGEILESPAIIRYNRSYYLFYFNTSEKQAYYRIGRSTAGPWQGPYPLNPGWAHEVWQNQQAEWLTSYLTGYSVTISPLAWDKFYRPARPLIGENVFYLILPLVLSW